MLKEQPNAGYFCFVFQNKIPLWFGSHLTLTLTRCHLKMNSRSVKSEICKPFFFLALAHERISINTQSTESRYGMKNTLFAGMCVHF